MSATQRHKIDLDTLQQQQLNAAEYPESSEIEQTTGNRDDEYKFPKHEQHLMHVKLTKKVNDAAKKEYRTEETTWKGSAAQYERMSKSADKGGTGTFDEYDGVEIMHDVRLTAQPKTPAITPASSLTDADTKKPLRSLTDAQERFKELVGFPAPADKTFTDLKDALAHLSSDAGADDLAKLKESLATA